MDKLHYFTNSISPLPLPEKFTYPFHYTPHPLCVAAAEEVQLYLAARKEWQEELRKGKMFGVLVVRTGEGKSVIWQPFPASWQGGTDTLISCLRSMTCKSRTVFSG